MNKSCRILIIILLILGNSAFINATTYYIISSNGQIGTLSKWWTNPGGTGSHPANFTTAGDIFILQSGQTCSGAFTMGTGANLNSLTVIGTWNTASGTLGNVNISGGTMTQGSAIINLYGNWTYSSGTFTPHNTRQFNIYGGGNVINDGVTAFKNMTFYTTASISSALTALNLAVVSGGNLTLQGNTTITTSTNGGNITIQANTTIGTLTIASGAVLTINANKVLTVTTLTNSAGITGLIIKSNSSGTGSLIYNGATSVVATVERFVTGGAIGSIPATKHYVSPAVSSGTGANLLDAGLGGYNVYSYNNAWVRVYSGTALSAGQGYLVNYNNNKTITFTGPLNYSAISPSISGTANVWNMLGNPYPCAITASSFISGNGNLLGTLYIWDQTSTNTGDYATCTGGGCVANSHSGNHGVPNGNIGSGQGFMVQSKGTGSTASFTNTMKTNTNSQFFIMDDFTIQRCYINITDPKNKMNEVLIAFLEDATNGFDDKYDGMKYPSNDSLKLYSQIDNDSIKYIIQCLAPVIDSQVVILGLDAGCDGLYTFHLSALVDFYPDVNIYLKDLLLNKTIDLRKDSSYSFNTVKGVFKDRFIVIFKKENAVTIVEQEKSEPILVYATSKSITISNRNNDPFKGDVKVYDMLGKVIYSSTLDLYASTIQIPVNKPAGNFIVSIRNEGYSLTKKVFVE
jgi:hypothetical protein